MLKKVGLISLFCLVVGMAFGVAILPQFQSKTSREIIEKIADNQSAVTARQDTAKTIRSGRLEGQNGKTSSGEVRITEVNGKKYVRLEENFSVDPWPDLEIYFGNNHKINTNKLVAKLKSHSGGQNYEIPAEIDENEYMELFIFSKSAGQAFGLAVISQQ